MTAPGPGRAAPALAARVVGWQRQHGRHGLPWQGTRDPYRVWLSEVMLQQTQVSTVLDYYPRFLARFATVQALAAAPLDDVLALWSGLGYYSRARHLHRCAQTVVASHGGAFPGSSAALATLPGIGRSTAAAIAAFCFGERAAILDGNVKRVLTRALGFDGDLARSAEEQRLWARAQTLLPAHDVDVYTQGLMDLGATVCLSRKPLCESCPLASDCVARAQGGPERYPVKTRRPKRGQRHNALLWLRQGGRLWLLRRPESGVWAGLWSLPEYADAPTLTAASQHWPGHGTWLAPLQHALTHFDWTLHTLVWTLPGRAPLPAALAGGMQGGAGGGADGGADGGGDGGEDACAVAAAGTARWFTPAEALALGLPAPVRRLLAG